jgi:hypothetical protein
MTYSKLRLSEGTETFDKSEMFGWKADRNSLDGKYLLQLRTAPINASYIIISICLLPNVSKLLNNSPLMSKVVALKNHPF